MLMIIAVLVVAGLCLGSFVNALVWRLYQQEEKGRKDLSIARGRSMCPNCRHELSATDLIPVLSWLALRGKCRYCHKPISVQYPVVELLTAGLFLTYYLLWPEELAGGQSILFVLWLVFLTGLVALAVYDLKWFILPNRIVYAMTVPAFLIALTTVIDSNDPAKRILLVAASVLVGGGIFYLLFQASKGKWIGGGDVKLGALLGLALGSPDKAVLFIFVASVIGSLVSLPLLASKRLKRTSLIPFGPLLIIGAVVVQLFGPDILSWYRDTFITY